MGPDAEHEMQNEDGPLDTVDTLSPTEDNQTSSDLPNDSILLPHHIPVL